VPDSRKGGTGSAGECVRVEKRGRKCGGRSLLGFHLDSSEHSIRLVKINLTLLQKNFIANLT